MKNKKHDLRIIFAGTPEFALPPLQALIDEDCNIAAVLTQPDRAAGRGKHLRASPVKQLALENGLQVIQPESLFDAGWQQKLADMQPDLMIVVAYGLMIPAPLLDLPRLGCWNIHASLLPRWRGAAPIQRAIEAGDRETGVCLMQIEATLDTGPVYQCQSTVIKKSDTAATVHDRLAEMGARVLINCIDLAASGELPQPVKQDNALAVYARKLSKAEAELDWNQPADVLHRRVQAFNPWPVAWCVLGGQRLRIWKSDIVSSDVDNKPGQLSTDDNALIIGTAEGSLKILEIQREGGQRMLSGQFLNAHRLATG